MGEFTRGRGWAGRRGNIVSVIILFLVLSLGFGPRFLGFGANPLSKALLKFGHASVATVDPRIPGGPLPGFEEKSGRIAVAVPTGVSTSFTFAARQSDGARPVTYDPCRPIHYVIRPSNGPAGGEELIKKAVAEISAAAGLSFVYDGSTNEGPSATRALYQRSLYGDRWAPVLITWDGAGEDSYFKADRLGSGGSSSVRLGVHPDAYYVTGSVGLDAAKLDGYILKNGAAGKRFVYSIILHEIAHVVGMGHTTDTSQLMYPKARTSVETLGGGDKSGLALIGESKCAPWL